tara:strand:+ start:2864 stop:3349 length:486 start_codon:yes stop_codon:yes gene_type:complete
MRVLTTIILLSTANTQISTGTTQNKDILDKIKMSDTYNEERCKTIFLGDDPDALKFFKLGHIASSEEIRRVGEVCSPRYNGKYKPGEIDFFVGQVAGNVLAGCDEESTCFKLCKTSIPILREYQISIGEKTEMMCGNRGIRGLYNRIKTGLVQQTQECQNS